MKDFDGWNGIKKIVDNTSQNKLYHKREVWWCYLGTNVGFEQDGTGTGCMRPVLILKGFSPHVCIVLPLTTSKKKNPYHVFIGVVGKREASVIISQIKLIDTNRLVNKIGFISIDIFETIRKAVKDLF
ncbi:MAG: type II toxin-antitoxin system PemK/MazF family toxin [bacterium]